MKLIILSLSFLFPEHSYASVDNLEELIRSAELSQQELAVALKISRAIKTTETSDMQQALPQSQIADADISIKLKSTDNP